MAIVQEREHDLIYDAIENEITLLSPDKRSNKVVNKAVCRKPH